MKTDIKKILSLAWPVMLGMVFQSLLATVDTYFISQLGLEQSASSGIANSISGVVFVMSTLVSAGTIALIARSFGEENWEAIRSISGNSLLLSACVGMVLGLSGYFLTTSILEVFFKPSASILKYSSEYLGIMFLGTVFVFLNSTLRTILQAMGDTRTPLFIFGLSNIINAILDYILMFIFDFGIAGAAFATVISNIAASIAIGYIVFGRIYNFDLKKLIESLGFNLKTSTRILRIGGWACLQQVARPITGMLMFSLVYSVGATEGSAAFNIGAQLFNYTFIILGGLSMAISVMVGQALGRNDIDSCDSIIKQGMKVAIINILVFGVLYIAIPGQIVGLFRDEPLVVQYGISYMRIVYAGIIFVAWTSIYSGVFQGAGDTFPPMISAMVANVVLKLPLAYLLAYPFKLGIDGVWIAISLSVVIEALGIIWSFRKGKWKQKQI